MKKILFTIQWYKLPPSISASANAICDDYIIEELKKYSDVEIHTLSYGVSGFPLEEIIDRVHVYRFKRSFLWDKYIRVRNGKQNYMSKLLYKLNRILLRLKQIVFLPLFPDYEPYQSSRFASMAIKLNEMHNYDMVISEYNGVDSLKAGWAIKKKNKDVIFLPICWDSISGGRLPKYVSHSFALKGKRRLANIIMAVADNAIVMESSRIFHDASTSKYDYYNKLIFLDVPYLVNRGIISKKYKTDDSALSLLYSGTMTDRSPTYLMDVMELLGLPVEITFVCLSCFHKDLLCLNDKYSNLKIRCLPYMPHSELEQHQICSDILINFGVANSNAVSGKIFDYMSLGKPIVSTIFSDSEACIPYLKKYPAALIVDERLPLHENAALISDFIKSIGNTEVDTNMINRTFFNNTPKAYAQTILKLLEK